MTYKVAFVSDGPDTFRIAVSCYRADVKVGDIVYINERNKSYYSSFFGIVREIHYLGPLGESRIVISEAEEWISFIGKVRRKEHAPRPSIFNGILNHELFIKELSAKGWITLQRHRYRSSTCSHSTVGVYSIQAKGRTAFIYLHNTDVFLQVIDRHIDNIVQSACSRLTKPNSNLGNTVHHALSMTSFNLYDGLLRFSKSFIDGEKDLSRYFISQGEKNESKRFDGTFGAIRAWETHSEAPKNYRVSAPTPDYCRAAISNMLAGRQASTKDWRAGAIIDGNQAHTAGKRTLDEDLRDIYFAISESDGEAVYMSDGMWLNSDGSIDHKGR